MNERNEPARIRRLTADIPGLGGRIRETPEDFRVEELPLYRPTEEGDHLLFEMEKRGLSTFESLLYVSKAAKVSEHTIGYAGLKDARAVTTQWMSVHRVPPGRLVAMKHPKIRILSVHRHASKIRIGHLAGNRFTIRIRGARVEHLRAGRETLGRLAERGVPNAYGVQRFGVKHDGHILGRALVLGDFREFLAHLLGHPHPREADPRVRHAREAYDRGDLAEAFENFPMKHRIQKQALSALLRTGDPRAGFEALGKRPRRIYVSAYQSYLFNRCLDARLRDDTYDRLLPGDLAWQHDTGALYPSDGGEADFDRARRFEASPSGPLEGFDMRAPTGVPRDLERRVLDAEGLTEDLFRAEAIATRGGRRPYRVPLIDASLEEEGPDTVLARFTLPPGSFATVVLDELMKTSVDPGALPTGEPSVGSSSGLPLDAQADAQADVRGDEGGAGEEGADAPDLPLDPDAPQDADDVGEGA